MSTLPPKQAWEPVSVREWTPGHARHLFRRAAWGATPSQVAEAMKLGPVATVERMFGKPPTMPMPADVAEAAEGQRERYRLAREASSPEERSRLQREARRKAIATCQNMSIRWLEFASDSDNAAYEKWVAFLQNVFVVSFEKVRNPNWVFRHHDLLRANGLGTYPDLCRAVSRSPAMIIYLDLQQSGALAPNENFARELFELFILGEGAYTENDIKEAARAFTGHRHRNGEFYFAGRQHDDGAKTVFGRRGKWTGDDVINLAHEQNAAALFLPREMCRFYLTDRHVPEEYVAELGAIWRKSRFNLQSLLHRFFTSRIFYHESFRGNLIKSPIQFHLGLLNDLELTVPPFPRTLLPRYRQMGQELYHPPNVRGWVGGRLWINASTLSARRQLIASLFQRPNPDRLNADELRALDAARKNGPVRLYVTPERLRQIAAADPETVAGHFADFFLAPSVGQNYRKTLASHLADGPGNRVARIRAAAEAILQSPEYNLC